MPLSGARRRLRLLAVAALVSAAALACNPALPQPSPTALPRGGITPYRTGAPGRATASAAPPQRTATPLPTPTPTPITYQVVKGDTLLGIALRNGVSLEDLMAANPQVDPNFLSIGAKLVIPAGESAPQAPPSPTPLPVRLGTPACYRAADGGLWCFTLARNDRSGSLENLAARLTLYSAEGEFLAEEVAIAPLNLLPAGREAPLTAFFPSFPAGPFTPVVELLAAMEAGGAARYLKTSLQVERSEIEPGGLQATVSGTVTLARASSPATLLWLVAVAYDGEGKVAGVRKWEAGEPTEIAESTATPAAQLTPAAPPVLLRPGESLPFEITVYSLGAQIARLEVLAEARP